MSIAAQRVLATSLLSVPEVIGAGDNIPTLDEVLAEGRYEKEVEDALADEIMSIPHGGLNDSQCGWTTHLMGDPGDPS